MKQEPWEIVRKQVEVQTREDLGHATNMRREGYSLSDAVGGTPVQTPSNWTCWRKKYYIMDRGETFVHSPETFYGAFSLQPSLDIFSRGDGSLSDFNQGLYTNAHYAIKVLSEDIVNLRLPVESFNCSLSVYTSYQPVGDITPRTYNLCFSTERSFPPYYINIYIPGNVWTTIHVFFYNGTTETPVNMFRGLANYPVSLANADIDPPGTPWWCDIPLTTELLDPTNGSSKITLFWNVPPMSEFDWLGNGIYRRRAYTPDYGIMGFVPDNIIPHTFAGPIAAIAYSGNVCDKFVGNSTVTFSGQPNFLCTYDVNANTINGQTPKATSGTPVYRSDVLAGTGTQLISFAKYGGGVEIADSGYNYCINPSFYTNTTSWTNNGSTMTRISDDGVTLGTCCHVVCNSSGNGIYNGTLSYPDNDKYLSFWLKMISGVVKYGNISGTPGNGWFTVTGTAVGNEWIHYSTLFKTTVTNKDLYFYADAPSTVFRVTDCQVEAPSITHATPFDSTTAMSSRTVRAKQGLQYSGVNVNTSSGTVRFWMTPLWDWSYSPGYNPYLIDIYVNSTNRMSLYYDVTADKLMFYSRNSANSYTISSYNISSGFNYGDLLHVAATWQENSAKIYLNGVCISDASPKSYKYTPAGTPTIYLGCMAPASSGQANCVFDEFAIEKNAWPDWQVWDDYNSTVSGAAGSQDLLVKQVGFVPANLIANNNFTLVNSSGYPSDWVITSAGTITGMLVSEPYYGQNGFKATSATGTFYITSSAFSAIDLTKPYNMSVNLLALDYTATASMRVYCYNSSYALCTPNYIEMTMTGTANYSGWGRYSKQIGPYGDTTYATGWPVSAAYIKTRLTYFSGSLAYSNKTFANVGLCVASGDNMYSPLNYDSTVVLLDGLSNGIFSQNDTNYQYIFEHISDRYGLRSDRTQGYCSYEDIGVRFGDTYEYCLNSFDLAANRSPMSIIQHIVAGDTTPPAQVTNLRGISFGYGIAGIGWTNPIDNDFYLARIYDNAALPATGVIGEKSSWPGSQDSYQVDVPANSSKTFWVTTVDNNGNENRTAAPSVTVSALVDPYSDELTLSVGQDWYGPGAGIRANVYSPRSLANSTTSITVKDSAGYNLYNGGSVVKDNAYAMHFTYNVSGTSAAGLGVIHVELVADDGTRMNGQYPLKIDVTAPTLTGISIVSDGGITADPIVLINVDASDADSGLYQMAFSESAAFKNNDWRMFSSQYQHVLVSSYPGNHTVYCKVRDNALNESTVVSGIVCYDPDYVKNYLYNASFERYVGNVPTGLPIGLAASGTPIIYGDSVYGKYHLGLSDTDAIIWEKVYLPPNIASLNYGMQLSWYSRDTSSPFEGKRTVFEITFYDVNGTQVGDIVTAGNGFYGAGYNSTSWTRFNSYLYGSVMTSHAGASWCKIIAKADTYGSTKTELDAVQFQNEGQVTQFRDEEFVVGQKIIPSGIHGEHIAENEIGRKHLSGARNADNNDYSAFNAGGLGFYNSTGGQNMGYIKGIVQIPPAYLTPGQTLKFSDVGIGPFSSTPTVILTPVYIPTVASLDPTKTITYLDTSPYCITTSSIFIRAVLRAGPSLYSYTTFSGSNLFVSGTVGASYATGWAFNKRNQDIMVASSGSWNQTHELQMYYHFTAPNVRDYQNPFGHQCTMTFAVWTSPATGYNQWTQGAYTESGFQSVSFRTDGSVYSGIIYSTNRVTYSSYAMKLDWAERLPNVSTYYPSRVDIDKACFINKGSATGNTEITNAGAFSATLFIT
jgi:hypothetical protein